MNSLDKIIWQSWSEKNINLLNRETMLTLKKSHQPEIKSDFLTNLKDSWCYVLCLLLLPSVAMRETTRSEFSNRSQNLSKKSLEQTSITSARKQKAVKSIRKTQLQKQLWPRHPWFPTLSDWEKTSSEWIHLGHQIPLEFPKFRTKCKMWHYRPFSFCHHKKQWKGRFCT